MNGSGALCVGFGLSLLIYTITVVLTIDFKQRQHETSYTASLRTSFPYFIRNDLFFVSVLLKKYEGFIFLGGGLVIVYMCATGCARLSVRLF